MMSLAEKAAGTLIPTEQQFSFHTNGFLNNKEGNK